MNQNKLVIKQIVEANGALSEIYIPDNMNTGSKITLEGHNLEIGGYL